MRKITIVGAGNVGATTAFLLAESALAEEIVIIDVNRDRADGQAWDIAHGVPLMKPQKVYEGTYEDAAGSSITIITVGVPEVVGESRLVPLQKNADILNSVVPQIVKYSPNGLILVVSNPVDILTYFTYKISGLPKERVLGLGTVLDSSRLCCMLSRDLSIDGRSIHAYMIGEHGDSQIPAWSMANVAGVSIKEYASLTGTTLDENYFENICEEVKQSAFDVWQKKGPNCYCVAEAIRAVVEALLRDTHSVLPVSSLLTGEYGIDDICISVPCIVGKSGVIRTLELPFNEKETEELKKSAALLQDYASQIKL